MWGANGTVWKRRFSCYAPHEAQGCTPPPPRSVYRRLHDDPRWSPAPTAPPPKSESEDSALEMGGTETPPQSAGGSGSGVCGDAARRPQRGRGTEPPRDPRSRIRRQRWRSVGGGDPKDCGSGGPKAHGSGIPKERGVGVPKGYGDGGPKNCATGDPKDHGIWVPKERGGGDPKDCGNGVPKNCGTGYPKEHGNGVPKERGIGVPKNSGIWIPKERGNGGPKYCAVGGPKAQGTGVSRECGNGDPKEHQNGVLEERGKRVPKSCATGVPQERCIWDLKERGVGDPKDRGCGDPKSCAIGVVAPPGAVPPAQGLRYLELLCRTLERLARLQEDNRQLRQWGGGGAGSLRAPLRPPSDGDADLGTGRAEPFRTRSCSDSHTAAHSPARRRAQWGHSISSPSLLDPTDAPPAPHKDGRSHWGRVKVLLTRLTRRSLRGR